MSVVFDFSDSLNDIIPLFPISLPVEEKRKGKSELLMNVFCVSSFFLFSLPKLSSVSVVFDFNASLNDIAPVSPTLFPVYVKRIKKSELLIYVFRVFLLSSLPRWSSVSVVFDFNDSLNDVAPVSPMLLSVHENQMYDTDIL